MNNNSKILVAAAAGMVAGAVLGILFAPDKGAETREEINEQIKKLAGSVESTFNKGKDKFHEIKDKVEHAVNETIEQFS
ncbi:MAG TPA: YtxH domain-containing protein [Hanamia sp.]|nr:YtxH domain-containing protein [Hanamia sp.]